MKREPHELWMPLSFSLVVAALYLALRLFGWLLAWLNKWQ